MSDDRRVLALNPGSSSLKASLRGPELICTVNVERLGSESGTLTVDGEMAAFTGDVGQAIDAIARHLQNTSQLPDIVAHRVVHGGEKHYAPTIVDLHLLDDLQAVIPLAPLHLPGDLAAIRHAHSAWPHATQVACFDTGFHHTLPLAAQRLPVSEAVHHAGVRRYGFHGLSIQSVLDRHRNLGGAVIAHLGSGCSVSAVQDGRSRYTTMSLTPTGGMMSATRTGDLDPEIVLLLLNHQGIDFGIDELRRDLDHNSGLAGIADGRHDVRDLLAADDDNARLATDIFCDSAARAIVGCATALDRWDTLIFTGGIGEHADEIRDRIGQRIATVRGSSAGTLPVLVVPAEEDLVMDRLARELLS